MSATEPITIPGTSSGNVSISPQNVGITPNISTLTPTITSSVSTPPPPPVKYISGWSSGWNISESQCDWWAITDSGELHHFFFIKGATSVNKEVFTP